MAADFGRGTLWDAALFNLETTESVQFDGHYPTAPLDPTISVSVPLRPSVSLTA